MEPQVEKKLLRLVAKFINDKYLFFLNANSVISHSFLVVYINLDQ